MSKRTIMVVDDEHPLREAIRNVLEFEGYKVLTARDGREGMMLLRKIVRPCLILLDMMMPGMDGWDFLDGMRKETLLASIPVVVMTGSEGKTPPGTVCLKKPFRLDTLLRAIRRHCP